MELEKKLVLLRREHGLSQLKLAEELGVSRQAVSRWEAGIAVPSTENLKYLSQLYQVPVDYLLNDGAERPDQEAIPPETGAGRAEPERPVRRNRGTMVKCIAVIACALALGLLIYIAVTARQAPEMISIEDLEGKEVEVGPDDHFSIKPW